LFKDRHRSSDIRLRAAGQSEQFTLLRWSGAAADRTFDEGRALARNRCADRDHRVRTNRAHIDQQLAGKLYLQDTGRSPVDRLGRGVVQQHHDDGLASFSEVSRRREQLRAGFGQRLCFRRITIPDANLMPDRYQPLRDRRSHSPRAAYADLHF